MCKSKRTGIAVVSLLIVLISSASANAQNGLGLTATPSPITFAANSPGSNIAGSSGATVTWTRHGKPGGTWTLTVGTSSTTFTGCITVPITAVMVRCASASHNLNLQ